MNDKHSKNYQYQNYKWQRERFNWNVDEPATIPGIESAADSHIPRTDDVNIRSFRENFTDDMSNLYEVIYPSVAAGAFVLLIIVTLLIVIISRGRRRRMKQFDEESMQHSVLILPNKNGEGPQFITKEIQFSVPLIKSTSLENFDNLTEEPSIASSAKSLNVSSNSTAHRSNSFSSYGLGVIDPALYLSAPELEIFEWPEGHLGRLWFTLRYEPATEKLIVTVLKAKNLPSRTVGTVNSCDPFIRLYLIPDQRRYLQSRQKKKTCNPYFDEVFIFQVSIKTIVDHILKLSVIDAGRTKRRDVIGHVTFPLKNMDPDHYSEAQLYKIDLEKEAQEFLSDLGELLLSLLYNENLNRLTVTVIEGRRLKLKEDGRDTYVRVTLNQHYRAVKVKKTGATRPRADGTILFSECFNFRIPNGQQDLMNISFHVLHTSGGYGRDKLIGKCVLGSYMFTRGKAQTQWNTAFANPMEQVQQWHTLSE